MPVLRLGLLSGVGTIHNKLAHEDQDHQSNKADQSGHIANPFGAQQRRLEWDQEGQEPNNVSNGPAYVHG